MSRGFLLPAILAGLLAIASLDAPLNDWAAAADSKADGAVTDPLGPNGACYVCHMTYVREELSKTHLAAKVTCIKCHGLSAGHANDENIGATKPDRTYDRGKINRMCRKCHKTHDVPAEAVIARWLERKLTECPPVCTDCHGEHGTAGGTTEEDGGR
jgi:hypothetical protein